MLVPVVYSVADSYREDTFYILTRKAFEPLFNDLRHNIVPIGIDVKQYRGISGLLRLGHFLRHYPIDKVADVHDVLRSKFLSNYFTFFRKKVCHINKGKKEKRAVLEQRNTTCFLKHTTERYFEVFAALGYPASMRFRSFFDGKSSSLPLPESLPCDGAAKKIGIAPFAQHPGKTYPPEQMEAVVKQLSCKNAVQIYLFGGKEDAPILEGWQHRYDRVISVAGKISLEQEVALMSQLRVMVSMDSANMHLASLVRIPVVSVWGSTHPCFGFYGFNQDLENAVQADLSCRPCSVHGNDPCHLTDTPYLCMKRIEPETIVNKILSFLAL